MVSNSTLLRRVPLLMGDATSVAAGEPQQFVLAPSLGAVPRWVCRQLLLPGRSAVLILVAQMSMYLPCNTRRMT